MNNELHDATIEAIGVAANKVAEDLANPDLAAVIERVMVSHLAKPLDQVRALIIQRDEYKEASRLKGRWLLEARAEIERLNRWCADNPSAQSELVRDLADERDAVVAKASAPVPLTLWCPMCHARHVDVGEFATKPHHTHACQSCGTAWRPAICHTVGVQFLPGFKDAAISDPIAIANGPKKGPAARWNDSQARALTDIKVGQVAYCSPAGITAASAVARDATERDALIKDLAEARELLVAIWHHRSCFGHTVDCTLRNLMEDVARVGGIQQ